MLLPGDNERKGYDMNFDQEVKNNKNVIEPKITIKRFVFIDKQNPVDNRASLTFKSAMEFEDSSEFAMVIMDLVEGLESVFDSNDVYCKYQLKENSNLHLIENLDNLQGNLQEGDKP